MPDTRLIIVDPGHFHATLVQKEMYPALSPRVQIYAPLGPDLVDYLTRIARFNGRADQPTSWEIALDAAPDFLDRLRGETPGSIAVFSGRNGGKVERIAVAVGAGLHVLADKPAIIRREDLPLLEAALDAAEARRLIVADMMTGRYNTLARLLCALRADPELFGEPVAGTAAEPGVMLSGVHYLCKTALAPPPERVAPLVCRHGRLQSPPRPARDRAARFDLRDIDLAGYYFAPPWLGCVIWPALIFGQVK